MAAPEIPRASLLGRGALALTGVLATAALSASVLGSRPVPAGVSLATTMVAVGALVAWIHAASRDLHPPRRAVIEIDGRGVLLDGALAVTRGDLAGGALAYTDAGSVEICLTPRGKPAIRVLVTDEEAGRALLLRLGLDASQAPATFPVPWPGASPSGVVAALLCAMGVGAALVAEPLSAPWLSEAAVVLVALALVAMVIGHVVARPVITVGRYGIERRHGRRCEHYAFADIVSVASFSDWTPAAEMASPQGLSITLASGNVRRWVVDHDSAPEPTARTRTILLRISHGMGARGAAAPGLTAPVATRAPARARRDQQQSPPPQAEPSIVAT